MQLVDLFTVIEHGAIVAFSRELNALITADGNLFIVWLSEEKGWHKLDFRIIEGDLEKLAVVTDLILKAELYLSEIKETRLVA